MVADFVSGAIIIVEFLQFLNHALFLAMTSRDTEKSVRRGISNTRSHTENLFAATVLPARSNIKGGLARKGGSSIETSPKD